MHISNLLVVFESLSKTAKKKKNIYIYIYFIYSFFKHFKFKSSITRLAKIIFQHDHLKYFQRPFKLHEFVSACKKSVNSICLFFRYSQFQNPETRLDTPIFDKAQLKCFRSTFNFCEFVSTCKKMRLLFLQFVLDKQLI